MSAAKDEEVREELRLSCTEGSTALSDALRESVSPPWSRHKTLEERARRSYGYDKDEWLAFHRRADDELPEARLALSASQSNDSLDIMTIVPEHVGQPSFDAATWNALITDFQSSVVAPAMSRFPMNVYRRPAPTFAHWYSYDHFERTVRRNWRYVWPQDVADFLAAVRATLGERQVDVPDGTVFWRAQLGVKSDWKVLKSGSVRIPIPYGKERMTPRRRHASEGRANPRGAPVLYLASSVETAVAEVRPWMGMQCTVSEFRVDRYLRVVDAREPGDATRYRSIHLGDHLYQVDRKELGACVWGAIGRAFARPVGRADSSTDYVPTQILAELMRNAGYDGVLYGSAVSGGRNLAIFDPKVATWISSTPYEVKEIKIRPEPVAFAEPLRATDTDYLAAEED